LKDKVKNLFGPCAIFLTGYGLIFFSKGLGFASIFTALSSILIWGLYLILRKHKIARVILAYGVFSITPILSYTGQIGVLTGFNGNHSSIKWLGVSFVMASISIFIYNDQFTFKSLFLNIMQPIRLNSGPIALTSSKIHAFSRKRTFIYIRWMILGTFMFSVIASGLSQLLILKESTEALDILIFGIIFEAYVYFNFVGITMMAFGALNLFGVRTAMNFNSPFSARNVIEYWQRWHISLSTVLKTLFFRPLKNTCGLPVAIFFVFISSALWHGVTLNFMIWGSFHALFWLITYYILKMLNNKQIAKILTLLLLPFIVVMGRIIFSESDSTLLLFKLQQVINWDTDSANAISHHIQFDTKTLFTLIFGGILMGFEFAFPILAKRYRFLRNQYLCVIWVFLCIEFSSFGIEGVYGTR
jgi:D-alanyl-lipoteichoic acid acyltransferase DltB (MBOAT superfamily)